MRPTEYGLYKKLAGCTLEQAEAKVAAVLKAEGFGILTRIDVKSTLREKLDVDHHPYVILGACNPQLAHRALSLDDTVGLLLPCNVVVAETEDGAEVSFVRPEAMFETVQSPTVKPIAVEAEERINRAYQAL